MVPGKKILYWPQTENQTNNYKEMAIMGENTHYKLSSTVHFKRKEAGS